MPARLRAPVLAVSLWATFGLTACVTGCAPNFDIEPPTTDGSANTDGTAPGTTCAQDSDCPAGLPFCNPRTLTCVECFGTGQCPAEFLCAAGACVEAEACTKDTECQDNPARPFCDRTLSLCVQCAVEAQCPAGFTCSLGACVKPPACDDDSTCRIAGLVCNPTTNACVECLIDPQCPDGQVCRDLNCEPKGLNPNECPATKDCAGLACGPDAVCGVSCGACDGQDACQDGQCVCVPACDGKQCGPDGCGGLCGECNDGNSCTVDTCDPAGQCLFDPVPAEGSQCEDGLFCTTGETCQKGLCKGGPRDCNDPIGRQCEVGQCNEDTNACEFRPAEAGKACDDGFQCTVNDQCDGKGSCTGPTKDCDDGDPCTTDRCDLVQGCKSIAKNRDEPCDDGLFCTINEVCQFVGGATKLSCVGVARSCANLGDICNDAACDEINDQCVKDPAPREGAICDDNLFCTVDDKCASGQCKGSTRDCGDGLNCTGDLCDEAKNECVSTLDAGNCLISNACFASGDGRPGFACQFCDPAQSTSAWSLRAGFCFIDGACYADGATRPGNVCQQCATGTSTSAWDINTDSRPCPDNLFCTINETCSGGVCQTTALDCSSLDNECNDGVCSEGTDQCVRQAATGRSCNDGKNCTGPDTCNSGGTCQGSENCGVGQSCDPANECALNAAGLPFNESFEVAAASNLGKFWKLESTGQGRIQITGSGSPTAGTKALSMDSASGNARNQATLSLDLAGGTAPITLAFDWRQYGDETDTMPDSFNGNSNSDGVAFSADGTTWYRLTQLSDRSGAGATNWGSETISLSAALTARGLSSATIILVRFQQFDNNAINFSVPANGDGLLFDNIKIFSCTPACGGKNCGADGCGGSCGTCTGGQTCNGSGVCQ